MARIGNILNLNFAPLCGIFFIFSYLSYGNYLQQMCLYLKQQAYLIYLEYLYDSLTVN